MIAVVILIISGAVLAASTLPLSLVEVAFGKNNPQKFTFTYISDSHITHPKGNEFVRYRDRGLIRAVAETSLLDPRPDFVFYGGDIAQLGKKEEIDHGLEILSDLHDKTYYVMANMTTTRTWVSTGAHNRNPTTTVSTTRAYIL